MKSGKLQFKILKFTFLILLAFCIASSANAEEYTGFGVQFDVNPKTVQVGVATPLNITFKGNIANLYALDQYCSSDELVASVVSPLENGQNAGFRDNVQASNVSNPVKISSLTPGQQINWDFRQNYTHQTGVYFRLFQGRVTCGNKEVALSKPVSVSIDGQAQPGQDVNVGGFRITPPWAGVESVFDLLDKITDFLLNVSIPIAVILIIYAGVMFLTSAGNSGRISKARSILWYTMLGFSVILIGKGFYLLIESILNLGK